MTEVVRGTERFASRNSTLDRSSKRSVRVASGAPSCRLRPSGEPSHVPVADVPSMRKTRTSVPIAAELIVTSATAKNVAGLVSRRAEDEVRAIGGICLVVRRTFIGDGFLRFLGELFVVLFNQLAVPSLEVVA